MYLLSRTEVEEGSTDCDTRGPIRESERELRDEGVEEIVLQSRRVLDLLVLQQLRAT